MASSILSENKIIKGGKNIDHALFFCSEEWPFFKFYVAGSKNGVLFIAFTFVAGLGKLVVGTSL